MTDSKINKIQHAQTLLTLAEINQLKVVTGESSTKEALSVAVHYTIKHMKSKNKAEQEA
ncbi:DUF5371 domain-containing protein [Candidatus Bathyarchaeota archaeon]|nr:DUF5371 domain-containing protein [Candidatus Bathyarchaeota archaeon]